MLTLKIRAAQNEIMLVLIETVAWGMRHIIYAVILCTFGQPWNSETGELDPRIVYMFTHSKPNTWVHFVRDMHHVARGNQRMPTWERSLIFHTLILCYMHIIIICVEDAAHTYHICSIINLSSKFPFLKLCNFEMYQQKSLTCKKKTMD